jgi:hypothetical protein
VDLVESCHDVTLQERIHLNCACSGGGALGFSQMLFSEQELTIEIRSFDVIGIGYGKQALLKILFFVFDTGTKRYHSVVFQKFASDCTAADHKQLCMLNLFE